MPLLGSLMPLVFGWPVFLRLWNYKAISAKVFDMSVGGIAHLIVLFRDNVADAGRACAAVLVDPSII